MVPDPMKALRRKLAVLCLLAPTLALAECEDDVAFLAQLTAKDPVTQAQLATVGGDFKLLAVAGTPVRVPGVDTARCTARSEHIRVIDGTANLACSPAAARLQAGVLEFARRYNEVIKNHLDAQAVRYSICR